MGNYFLADPHFLQLGLWKPETSWGYGNLTPAEAMGTWDRGKLLFE